MLGCRHSGLTDLNLPPLSSPVLNLVDLQLIQEDKIHYEMQEETAQNYLKVNEIKNQF